MIAQIPAALLAQQVTLAAEANIFGVGAFPAVKVNRTDQIVVQVTNNSTVAWSNGTTTEVGAVLQDVAGSAFTLNSWSAGSCSTPTVTPGQICTILVNLRPSDLGVGKVDFSVRYVSGAPLDSEHVELQATGLATYEVIQTDDADVCDEAPGSPCTLRGAINRANSVAGRDAIGFKIPGTAPFTIHPDAALPIVTDQVIIDAQRTQGPQSIELDGSGLPAGTNGIQLQSSRSIVRGLVINRFGGAGIRILGQADIEANFIGTDVAGTIALANGVGIDITGPGCTIGGTLASQRNVISGNQTVGIIAAGLNVEIDGNYIGTDANGTSAVPNGTGGVVLISSQNVLGDNVISGNGGPGVLITSAMNGLSNNKIGTNAAGTAELGNVGEGVRLQQTTLNTLYGNVISGNFFNGVTLLGPTGSGGGTLRANLIGTNASGTAAIPNRASGVLVDGAPNVVIGSATEHNVISGNAGYGVVFVNSATHGTPSGVIENNYIGLGLDGEVAILNRGAGVFIDMTLTGAPVASSVRVIDNLVANNRAGIVVYWLAGGEVSGNIVGSTASGTGVPQLDEAISVNFSDGVQVTSNTAQYASEGVYINESTNTLLVGNEIQHNTGDGVFVAGATSQRNNISVDAGSIWSNGGKGIRLDPGANGGILPPIVDSVDTTSGLTVTGRGVAGARLDIHADAEDEGHYFLGTTLVDPSGNWAKGNGWFRPDIAAIATAIRVGDLRVTATQTDVNGNTSPFSSDTIAPAAPVVNIVPAYVNAGNHTAVSVTVTGEVGTSASGSIVSTGGGTINAFVGTIPPSGSLSITADLTGLADGIVQASATLMDAANNLSALGTDTAIKDTLAPQAPGQPCIQESTDCKTTNVSQPTFVGIGAESGSVVSVYYAGPTTPVLVCSALAGAGGTYSCIASSALAQGDYTFWANVTDAAGNTGLNSVDPSCTDCGATGGGKGTVDTTPPTVGMSAPANGSASSSATPALSANATDAVGVASVQFQLSGDGGATWTNVGSADTSAPYTVTTPTLGQGAYQARSTAKDRANNTSTSTPVSFTVDTTLPSTTLTFPANNGFYNTTGWNGGCGTPAADICGTATDGSGSGIARVQVSIKRSDNKYWDGTGFNATTETFFTATGTLSWSFAFAIPADNSYTVHAQATDNANLKDSGPTAAITTDTVAPDTTLTGRPSNPSTSTASFQFSSADSTATFRCTLDAATVLCRSPWTYSLLSVGSHAFAVVAVDRAGNQDPTAETFSWTVDGDSDRDGLLDSWETNGVWYNPVTRTVCPANGAGCQFINLPAMGASTTLPNIFVQLDWMADSCRVYRPSFDAIKKVVDAFALKGIRLRVDMGSDSPLDYTSYPAAGFTTWGTLSKARQLAELQTLGSFTGNFYNFTRPTGDTAPKFFDEIKQEANGFVSTGREPFFRYAIFADRINSAGTSGISRSNTGSGGSDFIVSLGAFPPTQTCGAASRGMGTVDDQAGTFMHELGHGLGLGHGGDTGYNNKPDYPSIMSYAYQNTGVIRSDGLGNFVAGNYDYSNGTMPALDETALNEAVGLGPAAANFGLRRYCASTGLYVTSSPGSTNVDWSCMNGIETAVNTDVTGDSERNQDAVCVTGGLNKVIDGTLAGDDYVWTQTLAGLDLRQVVRTGRDRVCATTAGGDDVQTAAIGSSPASELLNDYNDWARVRLISGSVGQPGFRPAPPPTVQAEDITFTPAERTKYIKSDVAIRVNPGNPSPINLNSPKLLVGVFSTRDFDATKIVTSSVGFGPRGARPTARQDADYNSDGIVDAGFSFVPSQTGLRSGDTQACLTGTVQTGNTETSIQGCDTVKVK